MPELVYSPYATKEHVEATGKIAKRWRIDPVLFLNGIPIVTMELKSEFKQAVENAIKRFIHLEIETEEAWDGRKTKKETLIFPRYHQWDLVTRLVQASREEGPGHKYFAQHSAGSGKSNSIAWTAHQVSSLYDDSPREGSEKVFHSVIVTIQTFPHVLKAIEDSVSLKECRYAIIADEAHSSSRGGRPANSRPCALTCCWQRALVVQPRNGG